MSIAAGFILSSAPLRAQDGPPPGNSDPAQVRQRMDERLRAALNVKDEAEWQVISERVTKVMEARRAARDGGGMPGFRPPAGPPPGRNSSVGDGGPDQAGPAQGDEGSAPNRREEFRGPPRGFGGPPQAGPEAEALKKAIDAKASTSELKTKLAEFKAARAQRHINLEKAREDLRQVLSVQQEAVATTFGLL